MKSDKQLKILKIVMVIGLILFIIGHYVLSYSSLPEKLGIKGLIIGAGLMAVGIIMSLPTKMYLTFIWVKAENDKKKQHQSAGKQKSDNDIKKS